jgi:branched-chain amino acid transport system permease protein
MGSFPGAVLGGLLVGVAENLGGLFLGESLGPICVPTVFIGVLLLRPTGLFGVAR